jgi:prefoldin subunit 5
MQNNLNDINNKIQLLKQTAKELSQDAHEIPALSKNTARILASVKMLELNITDIIDFKES